MSTDSERQFEQITFSDFDCVKGLIKCRGSVDPYRGIKRNDRIDRAGDIRPMNPELIVLYVTLDDLISKCKLSVKQNRIIQYLMDGYSEQDISDVFKIDIHNVMKVLNIVTKRIVEANHTQWLYEYIYVNKIRVPFTYKSCSNCKESKPLTSDFYHTDNLSKDGFKNRCRVCR